MARRTTNFKSANLIEPIATKGLADNQHIVPKEKTSNITLTLWVNSIKTYMEERFFDTVFWVYDTSTDVETYLLSDSGSAEPESTQQWVETICTSVTNTQAAIDAAENESTPVFFPPLQLVCEYDTDNLK